MVGEGSADATGVLAAFGPGSRLAGYVLEEQVGAGGMAVVFRAVDGRLGRRVALKVLAPAFAADQAFRQRFIRESRAAAAVDDPYIIPVYEAGEAAGVLFIAMRLVPGKDVRTLLHEVGPLAPGRAAAIVSQVASALDAAHAAGLVHRDVKPANMLIDIRPGRPDHVYLADFGISKRAISSVGLTGIGQVLGTPDYLAPEQIEGRPVDGRTDQYALACAAFELLAGEPPFQRDQGVAVIWAHLSAPPPSLAALRRGLPEAVDAVFATALAKVPEDRFASCQEFAQALTAALGLAPRATSRPAKDEAVSETGPPAEHQAVRETLRDGAATTRKLGEDLPPARGARETVGRSAQAVPFTAHGTSSGAARQDLELSILGQSAELAAPPPLPAGRREPPRGEATFLFTDIEGSTWLVQKLGPAWDTVLEDHYRILRGVWTAHDGYEMSTEGDAFFVVFARPHDAVAAAVDAQRALSGHGWPGGVALKIRIGVHTGEARLRGGNYMGLAVHLASRVQSAAHGGQILVSGATRDALSPGSGDLSYVDLGRHRLKDIVTPVYLYQVAGPGLEWTFPAPRTLTAVANNFGPELSSFIGRRDDLAALRKILDQSRLVSLVGAGGVGKTRLAVRLATEVLGSFDGGAWLVDLASLSDASLIAAAALSALGAPGQPGRPAIDTLTDFLIRRRTLVVLDNCEHLLDGCAELVGRLLSACPDVKVLATTREAMNIPGEVLWKVRPLAIPDEDCALDGLQSSEAVVLFTDRTRAVEPDFEVTTQNAGAVTQICRRLDGMPLAIELAASRVRSMAVQELSSRLDDRFRLLTGGTRTALPRQRTLEATITWSYDLLSEEERVLFDRLSVFSGGCTTDSARRVCSGGAVSEERVLELVGLLADRSMLVADKNGERKTRYRMLETLRHFGQERLAARGESRAVRQRHLEWAINLAESYPAPTGPAKQEPEIIAEEHNLRSALEWALDAGDEESALRIIGSVWFGHFNERVALYQRVLPPSPAVSAALAAKALWAGLALAFMMGDWELGRQRGAWGAAAARLAGDDLRLSLCLGYEGMCAWALGAEEEGRRLSEEAVAVAQAAGLPEAEARSLLGVAFILIDCGDLDRAKQTANRARALTREVFTQGHVDEALGVIYLTRGELAEAAAQLAGTVPQFREIQINCGAHILETCAAWTAAAGRHELGAELLATAERIREETADKPRPNERIIWRDWLPHIAANTEAEAYRSARKRGRLLSFEQALDLAENSLKGYSA